MNGKKHDRIVVAKDWTGSRLDRFVRASRPALSFPVIQTLIRKGKILLNGEKAPGSARLKDGDVVEIRAEDTSRGRSGPEGAAEGAAPGGGIGADIQVLYEDEDLLAIDKPAGLPVQPGNRAELGSVLDLIARHLPAKEKKGPGPAPYKPSPVHRLDIGTSGVLIIAKTRAAARSLLKSFSEGEAVKTYLAVVDGAPASCSGTIDTPLVTRKGRSSRSVPGPSGRQAVTHFSVLRELPGGRTLLEVRIETGRTHQIRAHLQSIGCPVSGDADYGDGVGAARLMLHAWKIAFPHPATGGRIEIIAPPPPEFGLQHPPVF